MYWREPGRPVIWTKDGRLVYVSQPEADYIIWNIKLTLKRLINHKSIDGFTNDQLYHVCVAYSLRVKELEIEQNKER